MSSEAWRGKNPSLGCSGQHWGMPGVRPGDGGELFRLRIHPVLSLSSFGLLPHHGMSSQAARAIGVCNIPLIPLGSEGFVSD